MSNKLNCWEYTNCGLESGGALAGVHGVCPAATAFSLDGENGGRAAGRCCWQLRRTVGSLIGPCCAGQAECHNCRFRLRVIFETEPVEREPEEIETQPAVVA